MEFPSFFWQMAARNQCEHDDDVYPDTPSNRRDYDYHDDDGNDERVSSTSISFFFHVHLELISPFRHNLQQPFMTKWIPIIFFCH